MSNEIAITARHSPRVRTRETAENFFAGFREEAEKHGIKIAAINGKRSTNGINRRRQLEAIPEASAALGKKPFPKEQAEREALADIELANVDSGKHSEHLISKQDILAPKRMGLLLTSARSVGELAQRLGNRVKGMRNAYRLKEFLGAKAEPSFVTIFLRHSKNKGDQLTEEGKILAREQGRKTAAHLMKYFFSSGKRAVRPTVSLYVSHGGSPKIKGQLDWVLEHKDVLGRPVEELGGKLSHAEGLITLAYRSGKIKRLMLRQQAITEIIAKPKSL